MATTQIQLVMPNHVNPDSRLFGGQLMAWIDIVSGIEARRYTHSLVTTACVDHLDFVGPARLNDVLRIESRITWTGHTSMEVLTETFVENTNGNVSEDRLINRAYLVFVALDKEEHPLPIKPFVPKTEQEKADWKAGEARNLHRKSLRQ